MKVAVLKKRWFSKWIILLAVILLCLGFLIPIPYYIEGPGAAVSLNQLITVDGKEDQEKGRYMLTTVAIRHATPITYFMKYLPFHEGVTEKELFGTMETSQEYNQLQKYYMISSINGAIQAAYEQAGEQYDLQYNGVYVMSLLEGSQFKDLLQSGDTIIALDGKSFDSSQEFIDYVQQQKEGQKVTVTYQRDDKEQTAAAKLMKMKETGKPGLGISLVDDTTITTDIPVSIDAGSIGGPSAGFMFALQIYTQLTDKQLRNGNDIAGTGTISPDGTIGRIGGIDKKVVAADKEGAQIFFAPDDEIPKEIAKHFPEMKSNYEEAVAVAKKIDTDMTIVPVKHFQDAVDYLEKIESIR